MLACSKLTWVGKNISTLCQAYRLDASSSIEVAMVKGGLAPLAYIDEELEEQEGGALGL